MEGGEIVLLLPNFLLISKQLVYRCMKEADLYFDGASRGNPGLSGVGIYIIDSSTKNPVIEKSVFIGKTTNNVAEYTGLIIGLKTAKELGITRLNIFSDSLLVVNHIKGIYKIKNSRLLPLYTQAVNYLKLFGDGFEIAHILRAKNSKADQLANIAIDKGE
jgi:ribonuclease HI